MEEHMKQSSIWFGIFFAALCSLGASAQSVEMQALLSALKQGGYVIVLRHGATNRDQADTDPLNFDNVPAQRVLSTQGRAQAKQLGEAFKTLDIRFGQVYTSKFNRAVETGRLATGLDVISTPDLTEGGLVVTPIENDRRTEALRKLAATPPMTGTNTLIVTHKPNILDAFGKDWFEVKEGEASVFKPDGAGTTVVVGRVQLAEWIKAAQASGPASAKVGSKY
jgi:broad specificity phosphatase PhoE